MGRDFIHIGQRKTATTWLQIGLRQAHQEGVISLANPSVQEWIQTQQKGAMRNPDFAALTAIMQRITGATRMISREMLISFEHNAMAEALKAAWPDASILVTTRNPGDYVRSSYTQFIKGGNYTGAAKYGRTMPRRHMMRTHDFNGIHAAYAQRFGAENVHFYPYEEIRARPAEFLAFVEGLSGAPVAQFVSETRRNVSPPLDFLDIARGISERMHKEAPDLYANGVWQEFLWVLLPAIGYAEELWPEFRTALKVRGFTPDASPPEIDDEAKQQLGAMATVLDRYPLYAPHREAYGLA